MIYYNLLKFFFVRYFCNKKEFSLTFFGTLKYDWVTKTMEIFNFLPQINNSVTTEFNFLL